jgi:hypothetical protein
MFSLFVEDIECVDASVVKCQTGCCDLSNGSWRGERLVGMASGYRSRFGGQQRNWQQIVV